MHFKILTFHIALAVFFVQLIQLQPDILTFPELQYGALHEVASSVGSNRFPTYINDAILASYAEATYESVIFTGDIMMARNVEFLMKRNSPSYPFESLALKSLAEKPAIVGNFESAIAEQHTPTPANVLKFSTDRDNLTGLVEAGFTNLSLANNHSNDYGSFGFANTEAELIASGMSPFGFIPNSTYETVSFLETPIGRVALIGFNDSDLRLDITLAKNELARVGATTDFQVVYIHWGEEYSTTHSVRQEKFAREFVASGADLIVGHHPHVVQDIGIIDEVPVFYSLGNYVFDQYFSTEVQEGLVLVLTFDSLPKITLMPVTSVGTKSQPRLMTGDDKAEFLFRLSNSSVSNYTETIRRGYVPLRDPVASLNKIAMMF